MFQIDSLRVPGIGTHGLGIFARRPIATGEVLAAAAQFVDGGAYFWEWTKPIGLGTRRSKKGLGEKVVGSLGILRGPRC